MLRPLLGALLLGLLLVSPTPTASASASGAVRATGADGDRVVFTGTFVRAPVVEVEGATPVRRYQVAVDQVFGEVDITNRRVTVRSRLGLESCGLRPSSPGQTGGAQQEQATPGQPTEPADSPTPLDPTPQTIDKQLRVFDTTLDAGDYVVSTCSDVRVVDDAVLAEVIGSFGEGRPVGSAEETGPVLDDVGFLCPGTRDALAFDDQDSCAALEDDQPFDRAAAPGLALVIVGVLGLLVARRLGRSRRA